MTRMDYFPSQKTVRLQKNEAPRSNANFHTQDPTRFSVQEHSSLNTRIVVSHRTLQLHHQRRQLYKQEEEWFQNFSAVKRILNINRQHVNDVTRAAISESEDFER